MEKLGYDFLFPFLLLLTGVKSGGAGTSSDVQTVVFMGVVYGYIFWNEDCACKPVSTMIIISETEWGLRT